MRVSLVARGVFIRREVRYWLVTASISVWPPVRGPRISRGAQLLLLRLRQVAPRSFKLAAAYRRSIYYVCGSFVPFFAMVEVLNDEDGLHDLQKSAVKVAITSVSAIAVCLWANHWQIRADEYAVHRRRLFRWSSWTWDDFRSGAIVPGKHRGEYSTI